MMVDLTLKNDDGDLRLDIEILKSRHSDDYIVRVSKTRVEDGAIYDFTDYVATREDLSHLQFELDAIGAEYK